MNVKLPFEREISVALSSENDELLNGNGRGGEIAKVYTAQGQVNCHKVLVHRKFNLSHIKEETRHKDLSEAMTVHINSFNRV